MYRFWLIFELANIAFLIFCFIDVLLAAEWRIKVMPRIVWLFVVVIFSPLGGIIWFWRGKEHVSSDYTKSERAGVRPAQPRHPDDDPAFLKSINGESIDDRIARLERELAELDDDDPRKK